MRLPTLSPQRYAQVTLVTLIALTLIVLTGAGVRLTGSGLGCPDWPKCYGQAVAPLETHALIEYGNRLLSGFVGLIVVAAAVLAWRRRPRRRDLLVLSALPVLGVIGQAGLGALTVKHHLAPGFVMGHYVLSMVLLDATVALTWRAHHEPGDRPRSSDRLGVWATRALLPLGSFTILVGTAATAAGPHAGGAGTGDVINRLDVRGADTLDWMIHQHGRLAAVLGVFAVGLWWLLRRRGAEPQHRLAVGVVCALLALQGLVGITQYALALPAGLVWIHVTLAALTWLAILWAVAAAGFLVPRTQTARADERPLVGAAAR
ncbi:MAG: COX15/CtaA family protein [Actinomycetota bacterium]|nr:COX15/CtaA family protein [Actinomycetota bacterium]